MTSIDVKPLWRGIPFGIGGLALLLTAILLAMRGAAMLGPLQLRPLFFLMCLAMIALPWLLLSPHGRYQVGLKRPVSAAWLWVGLCGGAAAATLCFTLGMLLFGASADHWFVSVARSYAGPQTAGMSILQLHLMYTIAACLFSPIGEEIFFRGFLQRVLEQRLARRTSTHVEASLFAASHLLHHGLVAGAAGLVFRPVSGALWVALMFALSWLFAWLRQRSDSLYPAILAHSAFNGAMNVFIFAYLWPH